MKKAFPIILFFLAAGLPTLAQHPLEGTWEMVSITGLNADGEKFYLDTTTVRETKIITATHYILLAQDKEDGRWTFNRCYFGTVKMDGQKYYEAPVISSLRIFENVITDFSWKVDGDRFIQSGTITRPDGKKIVLHEFIFQRSKGSPDKPAQALAGTWPLKGTKDQRGFLILTPTHWMKILKNGDKLTDASGGEIRKINDKPALIVTYSAGTIAAEPKPVIREGSRIVVDGAVFEK